MPCQQGQLRRQNDANGSPIDEMIYVRRFRPRSRRLPAAGDFAGRSRAAAQFESSASLEQTSHDSTVTSFVAVFEQLVHVAVNLSCVAFRRGGT
jgi:hypothetical protein